MCNLYSLTIVRTMRDSTGNLPPLPGIFPDTLAPVVRTGEDAVHDALGHALPTALWDATGH